MVATPVVTRSAGLLHSQQFLVLLERHEVDGGVRDDPGEGGRVASPEREEPSSPGPHTLPALPTEYEFKLDQILKPTTVYPSGLLHTSSRSLSVLG